MEQPVIDRIGEYRVGHERTKHNPNLLLVEQVIRAAHIVVGQRPNDPEDPSANVDSPPGQGHNEKEPRRIDCWDVLLDNEGQWPRQSRDAELKWITYDEEPPAVLVPLVLIPDVLAGCRVVVLVHPGGPQHDGGNHVDVGEDADVDGVLEVVLGMCCCVEEAISFLGIVQVGEHCYLPTKI